jgi:hypothetical protein
MSQLFFDKILDLSKLENVLNKLTRSTEERTELWLHVDEIIHNRIISCCLLHLHKDHHQEFLEIFIRSPYDKGIIKYLDDKTKKDMKKVLQDEIKLLEKEIRELR